MAMNGYVPQGSCYPSPRETWADEAEKATTLTRQLVASAQGTFPGISIAADPEGNLVVVKDGRRYRLQRVSQG
jgi:hypothetical protein